MGKDPYYVLKYEYPGIKDVICRYSNGGKIGNYIESLSKALEEDDVEAVQYFLHGIKEWYERNLQKIETNEFVYNYDEHVENKMLIDLLDDQLKDYDFTAIERNKKECGSTSPVMFLSHKSCDKKYADALEKLLSGLGVKKDQLIYTSHPLHKVPLDQNIYEYLRRNINSKVFMIILWSNDYLTSPACLNEMGAAWVAQTDYTNIYTPDFDFGNPKYHECAVDTAKMGAVLNGNENCKMSMIEFRDKVYDFLNLTPISEEEWTMLLDDFINNIK